MRRLSPVAIPLLASLALACSGTPGDAPDTGATPSDDTGAETGGLDASPVVDGATETSTDGALDDASREVAPPADVPAAVAKLDVDLAKAVCGKLTTCCSTADYARYFLQFQGPPFTLEAGKTPAPADCEATVAKQLGVLHAKWVASVGRGRMTYDPAKAAACLAAIEASTCGTKLTAAIYDAACFSIRENKVFTKIAGIGSPCVDLGDGTYNGECDPEQGYCDGPPSAVTDRKCVAWMKPGEACTVVGRWRFCDTRKGSNCDGVTSKTPGTCSGYAKVVKVGDACTALTGPSIECPAGSFCDFGAAADGHTNTCVPAKADGEACTTDDECKTQRPYSCFPSAGSTTPRCGSTAFCSRA